MDYLDAPKQFRHRVVMLSGYVFIGIAVIIATYLLVNQANGFGLGKNGTVIQNGLLFVSSQPNPANIYLNGQLSSSKTNARLVLPEGIYKLELTRSGYRNWQRTLAVDGGQVEHFDYPLLVPNKLTSIKLGTSFSASPGLMSESPDRHWLVIEQPASMTNYYIYDLTNPSKAPSLITVPDDLLSKATSSESLQVVGWADDNVHLLLKHLFNGSYEYILLDRSDASQSLNLNLALKINPIQLDLANKKYNSFFFEDSNHNISSVTLNSPTPTVLVSNVLAYQTYGSSAVLYVTTTDAPNGKALVKLLSSGQTYILHTLPLSSNYLLNLTTYSGVLYVAAGATNENKVYVYRDPIGQLNAEPTQAVTPIQVLHVYQPSYISFSNNAQFIAVEGGSQFGVYDIENEQGYNYRVTSPIDAPQQHATWMDGDRLTYVSGNKLVMLDYDNNNQQALMSASSMYLPAFSLNYDFIYSLSPATLGSGQVNLDQTSLLTTK